MSAAMKIDYDTIRRNAEDWIARQVAKQKQYQREVIPASFPLGRAWFVVAFENQKRAVEGIADIGLSTFCPVMSRTKIRKGRKVIINDPLFPGYLFAHFDREKDDWGKIEDVKGVLGILKNGLLPSRIPDLVIERLKHAEAAGVFDYTKPGSAFKEGEEVEVTEGPFAGLIAKVKSASPKKRVRLLMASLASVEIDPCYLRKV